MKHFTSLTRNICRHLWVLLFITGLSVHGQPAAPASVVAGAMSQEEILTFLKQRIGDDPWRHPDKPKVVAELAALIRQRGVNFRYDTFSDFATKLTNAGGNESTIPFAIKESYRPTAVPGARPPTPETKPLPTTTTPPTGTSLMSQEEILAYLKQRIGDDPWRHPDKPKVVAELAALIRQRGVNFRYDTLSDFASKLTNGGGNESTIPFAIKANFGAPARQDWLMGRWDLIKIGGRTRFTKDGDLYERLETGANAGNVVLKANGTYEWNSASGKFTGKWRAATAEEMAVNYQGGAGVVLLKAKSGEDWIVSKSTNSEFKGDSIDIKGLDARQTIEHGGRK